MIFSLIKLVCLYDSKITGKTLFSHSFTVIYFILNYQPDFDEDYPFIKDTFDVQTFANEGMKDSIFLSIKS